MCGFCVKKALRKFYLSIKPFRSSKKQDGNALHRKQRGIFEYVNLSTRKFKQQPEPWAHGLSHICVEDPGIAGTVKRIVGKGGKQVSKIWDIIRDSKYPYQIYYTQNPWGHFIEICTRQAEQLTAQIIECI